LEFVSIGDDKVYMIGGCLPPQDYHSKATPFSERSVREALVRSGFQDLKLQVLGRPSNGSPEALTGILIRN
jgi:hypothetical protein